MCLRCFVCVVLSGNPSANRYKLRYYWDSYPKFMSKNLLMKPIFFFLLKLLMDESSTWTNNCFLVVKSYSDDKLVRVAVSAGRVLVSTIDSTLSVELFEGDMLEFSVTDKRFIKSKLINANYKAWLTGELVFNNMPLSDVFNTLEEVYRVKITTDKSLEVQNEVLNATFTNYSFSHVMTSVCASFNRITSYNVCYTKLLRLIFYFLHLEQVCLTEKALVKVVSSHLKVVSSQLLHGSTITLPISVSLRKNN